MCLYNPKKIPKTGFKGIFCYKVLRKDKEGNLSSPYYFVLWVPGHLSRIDDFDLRSKEIECRVSAHGNITYGAFHTYKNKQDAVDFVAASEMPYLSQYDEPVIAECFIPSDTEYVYEGEAPCSMNLVPGYASQSLRIIRILSPSEY